MIALHEKCCLHGADCCRCTTPMGWDGPVGQAHGNRANPFQWRDGGREGLDSR